MQTIPLLAILVGGILGLYLGAQLLVTFASKLALSLGMSQMMTGIIVVAFCTSSPELASSLMAQIQGPYNDIALGNVIGTNIANMALIMGSLALIRPLSIHKSSWKYEAPLMILVTFILWGTLFLGRISRLVGIIFCAVLALYILRHVFCRPRTLGPKEEPTESVSLGKKIFYILMIAIGTIVLSAGGYLVVKAAVEVGCKLQLSQRVIGITIVAIGTSLPEFAASCVALMKRMSDVALGNLFGSNVYNILMVLGIVSIVSPVQVNPALIKRDMPVLAVASILVWLLIFHRKQLGRLSGLLLVGGYFMYLFWILRVAV